MPNPTAGYPVRIDAALFQAAGRTMHARLPCRRRLSHRQAHRPSTGRAIAMCAGHWDAGGPCITGILRCVWPHRACKCAKHCLYEPREPAHSPRARDDGQCFSSRVTHLASHAAMLVYSSLQRNVLYAPRLPMRAAGDVKLLVAASASDLLASSGPCIRQVVS